MQASQRTVFSAPSLVRLLARVSAADVAEPGQSPLERLREWLSWTDAIALSNVLDAALPASAPRAQPDSDAEARLCSDARSALARAISASADVTTDYAVARQHYLSMQQMMEVRIGDLRDRLRQRLAAHSVQMARLAAIDETMERALGGHEKSLLGTVPTLLGKYFKRLQQAEQQALSDAQDAGVTPGLTQGAWLDVFRGDMQSALHAELVIRFQPIEGLLAALRAR